MDFKFPKESFDLKEQAVPVFGAWLRRAFLEDWGTKLIALLITLALWFGVTGQQETITKRLNDVRLSFGLTTDKIEISNEPLKQIEMTLTGDRRNIEKINPDDLVVSVNLTDPKPGDQIVQLTPETVIVDLPSGVKITEIQPNKTFLKIERREEREIEVKADFEGSLPDGMEVYETVTVPEKIRVRGPSSYVNSLENALTEKITLDGRKQGFTIRQVAVNLVNPKVSVIDSVVDLTVKIGEKRIERIITVSANNTDGAKQDFKVTLLAPRAVLESLDSEQLKIEMVKDTGDSLKPRLVLPEGASEKITVKKIDP
jgi:hypothetical protein